MSTGLVLGAGGVLGAAWTIGALVALEQADGRDPGRADLLIGTSAGSVLAAALGSGMTTEQLRRDQLGVVVEGDPQLHFDHDAGSALPPLPRPGIGSARGLLSSALHPWSVTPMAALSAALPQGRGTLAPVGALVDALCPGDWAPHPRTWVVALDQDRGKRVAFGRPGAPAARLSAAVMASCAIPGWYAPARIGGRRYVDGGVCSPTSADLVLRLPEDERPDEVVVLAPMASTVLDTPGTVAARVERGLRRAVTRRVLREVARVRATGTRVRLLTPGPDDLAAIGANLMDPRRRQRVLATSVRTSAVALARDAHLVPA